MKNLPSISTGQSSIAKTLQSIPEVNKLAAKEIGQKVLFSIYRII